MKFPQTVSVTLHSHHTSLRSNPPHSIPFNSFLNRDSPSRIPPQSQKRDIFRTIHPALIVIILHQVVIANGNIPLSSTEISNSVHLPGSLRFPFHPATTISRQLWHRVFTSRPQDPTFESYVHLGQTSLSQSTATPSRFDF